MSTTQSHEADLYKAIAYLLDLDTELEERRAVRNRANSVALEDLRYQLDHARKLVAALQRHAPTISCLSYHDGEGTLIDLQKAHTWCDFVEAKILRVCAEESTTAA